jgi:hypothetical protein
MPHKNRLTTPTLMLLLIALTLTCICPIVNASPTIPPNPTDPNNNQTIYPTNKNMYSPQFLDSQHFKEKTTQIDGYTHYISQPDLKTILDYIFTQSPTLLNSSKSEIYLNIKDHGSILNREVIAYAEYIEPEQPQEPTTLSIDEIIKQKNTLPSQLLIAKTSRDDTPFGVYINLDTINQLEPELPAKFKWISTYSKFKKIWLDTIYKQPEPKPEPEPPMNKTSPQFLNSKHFKEKTTQIDGYTYYISQPDLKTILDYIFTQSPTLLNSYRSKIYINDPGFALNQETIAYTDDIKQKQPQTPTTLSIDEIIKQKNTLPSQLLIAKTSKDNTSFGVYINLDILKKDELKFISKFKWISTYIIPNKNNLHRQGWIDTVYKQPEPPMNKTSPQFLNSKHFKEKTTQIDGYTYYISQPDLKTILDYIFTQSPTLLYSSPSKIYINIEDHGSILNREVIAYSRYLKPEQPQEPTTLSIDEIIKQKNTLPSQLLIAKTSRDDTPFGVYINLDTINQLEPELPAKFKWISTYSQNRKPNDISRYVEWIDTVYKH